MPHLEVTRKELEQLIESVMHLRSFGDVEFEFGVELSLLHLKLEDALELWINGGTIEIPVSPKLKALGVCKHEIVHQPHDEGCERHGE